MITIRNISDIIVLMDQGVVRKTGAPDSLEKYRDDLVQLLGAAVKRIDGVCPVSGRAYHCRRNRE